MPRRPGPLTTATAGLLVALVIAAPFALGGTRWAVQVALAGVALVCTLLLGVGRRRDGLVFPWPLWVPWGLVAVGLLQLTPLPMGLVATLSPTAAELWGRLADPPTWACLSLDPPATWIAVAHQAAFAAVLTVAMQVGSTRRPWVVNALMLGGLLVALSGALHFALQAPHIFWLFPAQDHTTMAGFFGPFVNNNTLAGYLCLTGHIALGVVAGEKSDGRARFALAAALLSLLGALASGSRGGQAAVAGGAGIFLALAYARGGHRGDPQRQRARKIASGAFGFLMVGLVGAVLFMPDWVAFDPTHPDSDGKLAAWPGALDHVRAFWATGSGRGSFEFVHPLFQSVEGRGTVTHPENIILQLASEWGVPLAALTLAAAVATWWLTLRAPRRATEPGQWGLVAGLAAASLQQLFDFGFEAAGLSLPIAAALGIALAQARPKGPGNRRRPAYAWALVAVSLALLGTLAVRAPWALAHHADHDARAVRTTEAWRPQAQAATERHPADALIALNAAARAAQTGAPLNETLGWLNRALGLAPRDPRPHLLTARALAGAGRLGQAATEYRLAAEKAPWRWLPLAKEIAARLKTPGQLYRALPRRENALRPIANTLLAGGHADRARALAARRLVDQPTDVVAHTVLGRACLALHDVPCVQTQADWLSTRRHPQPAWRLRGGLARAQGDRGLARQAVEHLSSEAADEQALFAAAELTHWLGDLPRTRALYDRLWRRVGTRPSSARVVLARRARTEDALGTAESAVRAWAALQAHAPSARAAAGLAAAQARLAATQVRPQARPSGTTPASAPPQAEPAPAPADAGVGQP